MLESEFCVHALLNVIGNDSNISGQYFADKALTWSHAAGKQERKFDRVISSSNVSWCDPVSVTVMSRITERNLRKRSVPIWFLFLPHALFDEHPR